MYDYHMHTKVSFDGRGEALPMAQAAAARGLREICFTDHIDFTPAQNMLFDTEKYNAAYDRLEVPGLLIRKGMEFGLTPYNRERLKKDLTRRHFDFIIGSIHFVENEDVYFTPYWQDKSQLQAERMYLEEILKCVQVHTNYDVLGHLTYISKCPGNPARRPVSYEDHRELIDQILLELVGHGKGMELNTSGMDACGSFLPTLDIFYRFHELGGRIVTVGSDAHDVNRVGQYTHEAVSELMKIFGHVCTFVDRKPVFHR